MRPHAGLVLLIFAAAALAAPLLLALAGGLRGRRAAGRPWSWRLAAASALAYALAFNLVFIHQELWLVIPKALTPGLHPVLYHNNHDWTGAAPIARLYQGAGAIADLVVALAAAAWLRWRPAASTTLRLFAVWLAYQGAFQALPQLVAGAVLPGNDVGVAMDYLRWPLPVIWAAAAAGVIAMAAAGFALAGAFLSFAEPAVRTEPRGRARFVLQVATLPALVGTLIVLPFRAPGALDQVVIVPVAVALLGLVWIQAAAPWRRPAGAPPKRPPRLVALAGLLVVLLAVFQLALRPGIPF